MASRKWNRPSVPTVGLVDTSLEIANRRTDVLQVIVESVLHLLKICSHLQIILSKLRDEYESKEVEKAEEDSGTTTRMIGRG